MCIRWLCQINGPSGPGGLEAAADQAAAPEPREELAGCALATFGSGEP